MIPPRGCPIDPSVIAFDIDGVVADTMDVFVRLAHERYGLVAMTKEDLCCYNLYECLDLEKEIIDDLICLTLDDEHTLQIPPVPGAPEVLTELSRVAPLRFVTARIWPESITEWLSQVLPGVPCQRIQVIASGAPEIKLHILNELGVRYFVEDRIETCRQLKKAGIQPFLFDQPWNRNQVADGLIRIENWMQLKEWVLPTGVNLR
ncbi:MAG: haloacid dehalogenase [Syntrophobacteraceae bacterium]